MPGAPENASVQEGIVKLADSNIEYFSQGGGESIVLLHFGCLTVGYMQELSNDLANAGYRVVRINFRGSGKSTGPRNGITLHTLAADVAGVIETLNLGKVNITGHASRALVPRMSDEIRKRFMTSYIFWRTHDSQVRFTWDFSRIVAVNDLLLTRSRPVSDVVDRE